MLCRGLDAEHAAVLVALFYGGMTIGRGLSGFLTIKLNDPQMIHLGTALAGAGLVLLLFLGGTPLRVAGVLLLGLGYAPIYPCVIHSTPDLFGEENSQAVIGVQMAAAYSGSCLVPPVYGFLSEHLTPALFPFALALILVPMLLLYRRVLKIPRPEELRGR